MSFSFGGEVRMFVGRVGMEPLGDDATGTPIMGDEDGVEPMVEVMAVKSIQVDWSKL